MLHGERTWCDRSVPTLGFLLEIDPIFYGVICERALFSRQYDFEKSTIVFVGMNYNLDLFSGGNSPIEVKRKSGAFSYKQPSSDMASTAALQKVATANPSPPVKPAPQTTSDTSPVAGQASKQESQSVTVGRRKLTPLPISTPPPPKDAKARTSLNFQVVAILGRG